MNREMKIEGMAGRTDTEWKRVIRARVADDSENSTTTIKLKWTIPVHTIASQIAILLWIGLREGDKRTISVFCSLVDRTELDRPGVREYAKAYERHGTTHSRSEELASSWKHTITAVVKEHRTTLTKLNEAAQIRCDENQRIQTEISTKSLIHCSGCKQMDETSSMKNIERS